MLSNHSGQLAAILKAPARSPGPQQRQHNRQRGHREEALATGRSSGLHLLLGADQPIGKRQRCGHEGHREHRNVVVVESLLLQDHHHQAGKSGTDRCRRARSECRPRLGDSNHEQRQCRDGCLR